MISSYLSAFDFWHFKNIIVTRTNYLPPHLSTRPTLGTGDLVSLTLSLIPSFPEENVVLSDASKDSPKKAFMQGLTRASHPLFVTTANPARHHHVDPYSSGKPA